MLAAAALAHAGSLPRPEGWERILASAGLDQAGAGSQFTILEGDGSEAKLLGFHPTGATVRVASVSEARDPKMEILWEHPASVPVFEVPGGAHVFSREKWSGAPLVAGLRQAGHAFLWTAAGVGEKGYERFPYLLQDLAALGVEFPFRSARTWVFFDSSYRLRADPDFLAARWRAAGIAALHAAAWHYYEPDAGRDLYLKTLIEACHRQGILVYAWLELPHVSERFWDEHPAWREKTAILQDAQLDWRKLMNLSNPDCARAVEQGLRALLARFDWDGVNLAELYFESLYGPADPQRFTPMNSDVRDEFRSRGGFDPLSLFDRGSPNYWERNRNAWGRFVEYRAALAVKLEETWLQIVKSRGSHLDVVLTGIDDRFDERMRENLGADTAALLALQERLGFTFAIEDPAPLWNLGPERYAEIARRYAGLAGHNGRLAVDINVVERYQDVYPTKRQTGTELFELAHVAGGAFPRVLLYFEHSVEAADYDLLPFATAAVNKAGRTSNGLRVDAGQPVGVRWPGPVRVDGKPWPVTDEATAWIPAGAHSLERGEAMPPIRVLQINADLLGAREVADGVEFEYQATSRAPALTDKRPVEIRLDGNKCEAQILDAKDHFTVMLPPGRHTARLSVR